MKKSRFTETQIVAAIKKQESGIPVKEICRELGISDQTFFNWKVKYGGLEVNDVKKMKDMEAQLAEYKKIVAEPTFENRAIKNVIEKKF
jgi:putative transposase